MIYMVCFLTSCIFFMMSEKSKNKLAKNFLALIAILLPCLLAGLRSDIIGTDVKVYVEPIYDAAQKSQSLNSYMDQSWFYIWRNKYVRDFEIGFTILVFIIVKLTNSLGVVLFSIHFLIVAPIYVGLKKLHKSYSICFGMLVFYLMFYNTSLNMMRQWIAMSILFMAFAYLIDGHKIKYCIFVMIACLFHISAIMGFVIMFVYMASTKKSEVKKNVHLKSSESTFPIKVFIFGIILLLSLNVVATFLNYIGLSKYVGYIQGDNKLYILPKQILLRLPIIVLFVFRWKSIAKEDALAPFYASMIVLDLLASQLMSINEYAFRISSFFSEYNIVSYSALVHIKGRKHGIKHYIFLVYVLSYIVCYWVYYYVITGAHATFPYVFA